MCMSWILPQVKVVGAFKISGIRAVVEGVAVISDPANAKHYWSKKRQAWLIANKQRIREYEREYSNKHRERINAAARLRYRKNPLRRAYLNVKQRRRRAMLRLVLGSHKL